MPDFNLPDASSVILRSKVAGDNDDRLRILADGSVFTGPGTTAPSSTPFGGATAITNSGSALTQRSTVDFYGVGVSAADDSGGSRTRVKVIGDTRINVKDPSVGAVGDGVTDDRAAIQGAITLLGLLGNGGTLVFPVGTYIIGSPGLVWPASCQRSITLQGESTGSSASLSRPSSLKRTGAYPLISCSGTGITDATITHGLNLRDLTLEGSTFAATLVQMYRAANSFWTRVTLKGSDSGALAGNARGLEGKQLWNCHFTDCYFTGLGAPTGTLPAVTVTDSAAAGTGTNTVHFTACEFEGNFWDDMFLDGPSQPAGGVIINGCKFERGNGASVRCLNVQGVAVSDNYFFQDINIPAAVLVNGASANSIVIVGNNFAGASATLPTYMIQLTAGAYTTITGNTFLGGANHVRLESGFGSATIVGNQSHLFNTPTIVSDARTTKTGIVGSNGRVHCYDGIGTKVKAGTPVNGDFQQTPLPGTIVYDSTAKKLWVLDSDGTTWKGVVVA